MHSECVESQGWWRHLIFWAGMLILFMILVDAYKQRPNDALEGDEPTSVAEENSSSQSQQKPDTQEKSEELQEGLVVTRLRPIRALMPEIRAQNYRRYEFMTSGSSFHHLLIPSGWDARSLSHSVPELHTLRELRSYNPYSPLLKTEILIARDPEVSDGVILFVQYKNKAAVNFHVQPKRIPSSLLAHELRRVIISLQIPR